MDAQSVLDAIRQGFAEVREEISEKITEEVRRQTRSEVDKCDETILHKQNEELFHHIYQLRNEFAFSLPLLSFLRLCTAGTVVASHFTK